MNKTEIKAEGDAQNSLQAAYEQISEGCIGKFDLLEFLNFSACQIASAMSPGNEQYVVMSIDHEDESYTIILGLPADSQRHGIWNVGRLKEPTPKTALIEAAEKQKLVVIADALNDPRVDYMSEHVKSKGIISLAVIPVVVSAAEWLIVIDKTAPDVKGFTRQEREYLVKYARLISKAIKTHLKEENFRTENDCRDKHDALTCIQDLIRNPFTSLMGNVRRIVEKLDDSDEYLKKLGKIALIDGQRLETEINRASNLLKHLGNHTAPAKIGLHELVDDFANDEANGFFLEIDPKDVDLKLMINANLGIFLFGQIKDYMSKNSRSEKRLAVSSRNGDVHFSFRSHGFFPSKEKMDIMLYLYRDLAKKLHATTVIKENEFCLTLPLKIVS